MGTHPMNTTHYTGKGWGETRSATLTGTGEGW